MIFCVSIFIFCLEPTIREQLDENDFRHCYGIFFRKYHSETTWSSHVQSSFATITTLFLKRYITVEDFTDKDHHTK